MAFVQLPAPTPPPEIVQIGGNGPPEAVFIAATLITIAIVVGVVLYPLIKAFARRLEGRAGHWRFAGGKSGQVPPHPQSRCPVRQGASGAGADGHRG